MQIARAHTTSKVNVEIALVKRVIKAYMSSEKCVVRRVWSLRELIDLSCRKVSIESVRQQ